MSWVGQHGSDDVLGSSTAKPPILLAAPCICGTTDAAARAICVGANATSKCSAALGMVEVSSGCRVVHVVCKVVSVFVSGCCMDLGLV